MEVEFEIASNDLVIWMSFRNLREISKEEKLQRLTRSEKELREVSYFSEEPVDLHGVEGDDVDIEHQ